MQFLLAVLLLVALMAYNVAASFLRSDFPSFTGYNPVFGMLVVAALLVAVYAGHFWARVVVGFQMAMGIIVQISALYRIAHHVGIAVALMSSWALVILVVCFVLLCFSPSVSMYLESHRTQHTD